MTLPVPILIVVHNHSEFLPRLIESLEQFRLNAYFCDAASTDNSAKIIENSSYSNSLLKKEKLESFSKNNNDLLRHFNIQSEYYIILNPDTYFDTNFVEILVSYADANPNAAIVSPRLLYPNGQVQKNWKRYPNFIQTILKRFGLTTIHHEPLVESGPIDWCLGACFLVRDSFIKERSFLFDERYRLYCEDIDICFDAHQRGYDVIGLDTTYVYHNLGESSSKSIFTKYNYWNLQSIIKFIVKWNRLYLRHF
ncbi:glycosyltransferase [Pontibacter akesuensis]|uniref:Glycosyltransferase, GT2 family n=1 Tax=Pontibacter akesuensis TaxID=388950 RepID=A0A1I7GBZ7_9BACT|nr:glycosyltransferase [Pontibacter akesuensis]SFU45954.1 Glycosyltransferase, GT2 family [Pontibacter akesuensis]